MAKHLTPLQERFVAEILIDDNATQAAIRAGYSPTYANKQAHKLVDNDRVAAAIQAARAAQQKRTQITADRVLQEIAKIAFFDPRKLFDQYGNPKNINEIDDDTAAAIAGLDVDTKTDGESDLLTITKKLRLADKQKALDMLGRHFGLFDQRRYDGGEDGGGGGIVMLPDVMEGEEDA